jgi:hypothetical protein
MAAASHKTKSHSFVQRLAFFSDGMRQSVQRYTQKELCPFA